jgi:hypothetical protein
MKRERQFAVKLIGLLKWHAREQAFCSSSSLQEGGKTDASSPALGLKVKWHAIDQFPIASF